MVSLGKPYQFNFLKGCVPQIILGPFLNTLTQMKNKYPARNAERLSIVKEVMLEPIEYHCHTKFYESH